MIKIILYFYYQIGSEKECEQQIKIVTEYSIADEKSNKSIKKKDIPVLRLKIFY